ncbi:MAG: hypothetical protein HY936_08600 [Nitrosomonadales bacterium]|nr:hypothetical protein [Nitrosomonadales bacterium]
MLQSVLEHRCPSCGLNPDYPLGRHSGEGRNPAIKKAPQSGQNNGVVLLAWEFVNQLDTGLRRYDAVSSNGLFRLNQGYPSRVHTEWIAKADSKGAR